MDCRRLSQVDGVARSGQPRCSKGGVQCPSNVVQFVPAAARRRCRRRRGAGVPGRRDRRRRCPLARPRDGRCAGSSGPRGAAALLAGRVDGRRAAAAARRQLPRRVTRQEPICRLAAPSQQPRHRRQGTYSVATIITDTRVSRDRPYLIHQRCYF